MLCEMCFKSKVVSWVLVDNDYETELCSPCIKALKAAGTPVQKLNV